MDLCARMRNYIIENFLFGDVGRMVGDDESLMDGGVLDSTGVMEIMMLLEGDYGIQVEDHELLPENFDSVRGIAGYLGRKLGVGVGQNQMCES